MFLFPQLIDGLSRFGIFLLVVLNILDYHIDDEGNWERLYELWDPEEVIVSLCFPARGRIYSAALTYSTLPGDEKLSSRAVKNSLIKIFEAKSSSRLNAEDSRNIAASRRR
ncbi:hypothetical protein BHYA_0289g00120 [Botrytis hyacinthi]|uniref:Uncharacterized protein n=1 Tax=Botrytis hyacinthi TaxID=278943 RepID=A0A4Z1G787_9HELO|nr:hypothetical protein BHYA_0289g00120 [Botrytis hyacinthi]